MTTGPPAPGAPTGRAARRALDREILRLALPALGALVAEPLYVLADTAVVGRIGTASLAGLALASSVLLVGYSVFVFLAYGTTAAVSRLLGAGDPAGAADQAVQSLWLAVVIGVGIAGVGWPLAPALLSALGGEGEVLVEATTYLRISVLGVPAMLVVLAGTGYLRGLQDTRTPLVVALTSATGNLVLEVVLVLGLGFGIGASALSTVVAQVGAASVYVAAVGRAVRSHGTGLRPRWRTIGRLGVVGRQLLVRTTALRAALLATTAAAAGRGTVALAAHQVVFEVWSLLALTLDAVAIAGQAMVGRLLGGGDATAARTAGDRMLVWGVGVGGALGLVLLALHGVLPRVFTDDAAVVATAATLALVAAAAQPLNGVVFVLDGLLIGAGDMAWLARAMVVALAGFVPALVAVQVSDAGVVWVWAALVWFMALRAATLALRWRRGGWAVVGPAPPG